MTAHKVGGGGGFDGQSVIKERDPCFSVQEPLKIWLILYLMNMSLATFYIHLHHSFWWLGPFFNSVLLETMSSANDTTLLEKIETKTAKKLREELYWFICGVDAFASFLN